MVSNDLELPLIVKLKFSYCSYCHRCKFFPAFPWLRVPRLTGLPSKPPFAFIHSTCPVGSQFLHVPSSRRPSLTLQIRPVPSSPFSVHTLPLLFLPITCYSLSLADFFKSIQTLFPLKAVSFLEAGNMYFTDHQIPLA